MTENLPEELTDLSAEDRERRELELRKEAAEAKRDIDAEQQEILDALGEEHGGDRIETACTIPGGMTATVDTVLNGELINRMSHVEEAVEVEDGAVSTQNIERAMDEAAAILADVTKEPKYSKEVFYLVYQEWGPEALGEHVEAVFDAVEAEVNRQAGAVDGFREQS